MNANEYPRAGDGNSPSLARFGIVSALVLASICAGVTALAPRKPGPEGEQIQLNEPPNAEGTELATLRAAVRRNPFGATAWRELGDHFNTFHRAEEAESAWRESLRLDPQQADVHWKIGTLLSSRGENAAAQASYQTALAIEPDHFGSLFNLGNLAFAEGRLDQAEQMLKRAADLDGRGSYSLGCLYAAQGRWAEAVGAFERSLWEQDGDIGPLFSASINAELGAALMELGRDAEATLALRSSLEAYDSVRRHPRFSSDDRAAAAEVASRLARLTVRAGEASADLVP